MPGTGRPSVSTCSAGPCPGFSSYELGASVLSKLMPPHPVLIGHRELRTSGLSAQGALLPVLQGSLNQHRQAVGPGAGRGTHLGCSVQAGWARCWPPPLHGWSSLCHPIACLGCGCLLRPVEAVDPGWLRWGW